LDEKCSKTAVSVSRAEVMPERQMDEQIATIEKVPEKVLVRFL
jgi:hypothetical protein